MRGLITVVVVAWTIAVGAPGGAGDRDRADLGRQTLPGNDGWASFSTGTTGGSAATADHVYTVTNRQQLVVALSIGSAAQIVYVQGTIDANVDSNNQPLTCADYAVQGYSLAGYLAAFDPATWGRTRRPSGPLEDARRASQLNQQAHVRINVPPNTTIVGVGDDARIVGANLRISQADNVIVRNITFQDAHDCFPQWDPTDGSTGNWNSAYDNISVITATHVWVDHCAFSDGDHPDSLQPVYFGRPYQVHDGELDITNAADLVTVSWNRFADHDKTMLIGSSDSATGDVGKLRITVHHNVFLNVLQRAPRVRFGQVHVYDNYYDVPQPERYSYSWGVGVQSQIIAENNYFQAEGVDPSRFIRRFSGTAINASGTFVNGRSTHDEVDVVSAYNAANDPDLSSVVTWPTPPPHTLIHPAQAVPGLVLHNAGPFRGQAIQPED
jgi:pectate lyase